MRDAAALSMIGRVLIRDGLLTPIRCLCCEFQLVVHLFEQFFRVLCMAGEIPFIRWR